MYNPKNSTPHRPGRQPSSRKALFALVSILVLVFAAAGVTVAYLQTQTPPLKNEFTPAQVSCEVEETFDGSVKRSVAIRNTGDADAFIRVAVVANWVKADDEGDAASVHAQQPQPGTDYTIQWADDFGANWLQGGSDFYYYKIAVDPEESTAVLIAECTPKANRAPEGYTLAVEIVASAIQASPEAVAEEYWHISVENGVITAVQGGGGNE